jgi:hypothetical protein
MTNKILSFLAMGILLTGLSGKEPKATPAARGESGKRTLTGCLTEQFGSYIFATPDGELLDAIGSDKLDKHRNHTVKLTGYRSSEDGKNWFHVEKIEHVASSCPK